MVSAKSLDIFISVGGLIYELELAANKHGATIYNICHNRIDAEYFLHKGWAVEWHEEKRQGNVINNERGLVIYQYYDTLEEMVKGEFERLGKESEK